MPVMTTIKMKKNKIAHILINILIVVSLLVSLLISPYKYEWEEELKQVNDNSVLVLRLFYIIIIALNIGGILLTHKSKIKFKYPYFILILFVVFKLVNSFFL